MPTYSDREQINGFLGSEVGMEVGLAAKDVREYLGGGSWKYFMLFGMLVIWCILLSQLTCILKIGELYLNKADFRKRQIYHYYLPDVSTDLLSFLFCLLNPWFLALAYNKSWSQIVKCLQFLFSFKKLPSMSWPS